MKAEKEFTFKGSLGFKTLDVSVDVQSIEERPWIKESHMCDQATAVEYNNLIDE